MPIEVNSSSSGSTGLMPDMSSITSQLEILANQLAVFNEQLVNLGAQFQITVDTLAAEVISLNIAILTIFTNLANTININFLLAIQSMSTNIGEAWLIYIETFFEDIKSLFSNSLIQFNIDMKSIWLDISSSASIQLNEFIMSTWNQMLINLFSLINETIMQTLVNLELGIISIYDQTVNSTYSDIKKTALDTYQKTFDFISYAWINTIEPMIVFLENTINEVKNEFINFLNEYMIPIAGFIKTIIIENWSEIKNGILNNFVKLLNDLINSLNEIIKVVVDWVVGLLNGLINSINSSLNSIIASFMPLLKGILIAIGTIVGAAVGFMIGGAAGAALGAAAGLSTTIIASSQINNPDIKIENLEKTPYYPQISPIRPFASGGVVTSPTYALIGEGHYSEAVIPLDNSPQMKDFIKQISIAAGQKSETPIQIFIGNEQLDEYIVKSQQQRLLKTNGAYA